MTMAGEDDMLSQATAGAADADADNAFVVDIEGFEGPLHLLLELARKHRVDLARISMLALADQYLAFVRDAQHRRIDLAADYLLMAAWLAYLKSKLLLPREAKVDDEPDGETMAGRLAFRLRRLEAMRKAASDLYEGDIDGRDVFRRGAPEHPKILRRAVWTTSLHDVLKAFGDINIRKAKRRAHVIKRQPVLGLDQARRTLVALAPELEDWLAIQAIHASEEDAKGAPRRSEVASFFSAALELTRDRALELRQDRPFSDVYVRRARPVLKAAE